jgi:hypothetical protein
MNHLTVLRNKTAAVFACGAGSTTELARFLRVPQPRVTEWINSRTVTPNGETTLRIQEWTGKKSNAIAMAGRKLQNAYRNAYAGLCERYPISPVNGKED